MNRVMSRAKILLVLILVLSIGIMLFLGDYVINGHKWVLSPRSPHVYDQDNIGCGLISDRNGNLILDLTGERIYAPSELLRKSTIHWVGDRQGNISAPALTHYAKELAGFDPVSGVYAYDGVGGNATLTLSGKLQLAAMQAMEGHRGTLAIYNYRTGEILCAITTPTFDPDHVPDISADTTGSYEGVYVNRFTQGTYIPGSIFKIVTMIAALDCIESVEEMEFTCTGLVEYGVDKVTCERVHGTQTLLDAFKNSCNCAFSKISELIGGIRLENYARELGVLDPVSFDGITTASGKIQSADQADVLVAWSAIGQHKDRINPASFLTLVSAVANDGIACNPYLVEKITTGKKVTYQAQKSEKRLISVETAEKLQAMMRNNVENYYGDEHFAGFTVCAKSGTAQVGGNQKPNAMFTGFVADEEYPLAFFVAIEDGGYGRHTCVPILEKVLLAVKL